jgi:hypothetical protein
MTVADPYPETLDPFAPASLEPMAEPPLIREIGRIATALEQIALALMDKPVQNAPGAALTALPPVRTAPAQTGDVCPIHGTPWKVVPAGISKKTGKAYDAFRACSTAGCDQRPR